MLAKVAFLFSGQGAQYVGMGTDFLSYESSKAVFDVASEVLGFSVSELCKDEERINITEYTQPAILTTSIAIYEEVKKYIKPDAVAGLSLGEYSALVASNVITFEDAVSLVNKRGKFMSEAVSPGVGAMAAVIGLTSKQVEESIKDIYGVYISNYNCPKQYVIGGYAESVKTAMETLKQNGARRVVELNVSGPFHTPLLQDAAEKLKVELENIDVKKNSIPIIMNYTGDYLNNNVKDMMIQQVTGSVRFEESIQKLISEGYDTFIEIGPGKVLSGFVKKVDRSVVVINVEDKASLEGCLQKLEVLHD